MKRSSVAFDTNSNESARRAGFSSVHDTHAFQCLLIDVRGDAPCVAIRARVHSNPALMYRASTFRRCPMWTAIRACRNTVVLTLFECGWRPLRHMPSFLGTIGKMVADLSEHELCAVKKHVGSSSSFAGTSNIALLNVRFIEIASLIRVNLAISAINAGSAFVKLVKRRAMVFKDELIRSVSRRCT